MSDVTYDDLIVGALIGHGASIERWVRSRAKLRPEWLTGTHRYLYDAASTYFTMTGALVDHELWRDILSLDEVEPSRRMIVEQEFLRLWALDVPEAHFRYAIAEIKNTRRDEVFAATLVESLRAMTEGVRGGGRGYDFARPLLTDGLGDVDRYFNADSPEGNIRDDHRDVVQEYEEAKRTDGLSPRAVTTGIDIIDQTIISLRPGENMLVAGYSSHGKAQPLDAKVLTPHGYVEMGSLRVGDDLVDPDGGTCQVSGIFPQGVQPVYRVEFSDGSFAEATAEHLWTVNRRMAGQFRENRVVRTDELTRAYVDQLPDFSIPDLSSDLERHLHPYVLGVLLGDGSFRSGSKAPNFTSADPEIIDTVRDNLPYGNDLVVSEYVDGVATCRIIGQGVVTQFCADEGLYGKYAYEKFVPEQYLHAPAQDRLHLLMGLMDTDGSAAAADGQMEFVSTSENLADAVVFLTQSLGGRACKSKPTCKTYTHRGERREGRESWRVSVSFSNGVVPFSLRRKAERVRQVGRRRSFKSAEYVRDAEVQCIKVTSPSETYFTDGFLRTHNTTLIQNTVWNAAVKQGKDVVVFTNENAYEQYRARIFNRHSHEIVQGGISMTEIKRGGLTPEQEAQWFQTCEDFGTNPDYGTLYVVQMPMGGSMSWLAPQLERFAEQLHPDLCILDYVGRMGPMTKRDRARDEMNDNLKAWKNALVSFDGGRGIAGITGYQISREAMREALVRGYYTLDCLAETSEAERNADIVVSILKLEDVEREVRVQILKNRDGALLETTPLACDFATTYIGGSGLSSRWL